MPGVRFLQIDEPAFVTRYDQPAELDLAIGAMRRVVDGLPQDVLVFTHMCYGAFHEVYPIMLELPAQVFCLELSHVSPELLDILRRHPFPRHRGIGFGVVDAMDPRVESVEEIEQRIRDQFAAQSEAEFREILDALAGDDPDLADLSRRYQQASARDYFQSEIGTAARDALLAKRGGDS